MVTRAEILWLAVSSGVAGALIGGLMLGVGMDLLVNGQPLGLLLIIPGAPAGALIGWWQGKKLGRQLEPGGPEALSPDAVTRKRAVSRRPGAPAPKPLR